MLSLEFVALALAAVVSPVLAAEGHHQRRSHPLLGREYITPETALTNYDYIIAGGGLAGLVLASKLSADGETTVLVLEAGPSGDDVRARIDTPATTYYESILNTEYDYQYNTIPQANVNNRILPWPRGRTLGGSSAVNGMYLVRPNSVEIDAWHDLIVNDSNKAYADSWTWNSLLDAMKGTETFTPPTQDALDVADIRFQADSHGQGGSLHHTYPAYMPDICSAWIPTLEAAGVAPLEDSYSGDNVGAFWSTMALNPANWTRSYAKSAYIDNLPPRQNLHILVDSTVTRILFADNVQEGDLLASGVEYARDASDTPKTVLANKEVIIASGAVGSPQLLMVSGVGPQNVLEDANIPVKIRLPGVGQHLQDHLATGVSWSTSAQTQGDIYNSGSELASTPEFLSFINSGIAYVPGHFLFGSEENFQNYLTENRARLDDETFLDPLLPDDPEIAAGYRAIYRSLIENVHPTAGLIEILYSINAPGNIVVQAALQTPLSQGAMYVSSDSVFDPPILDPHYFSHPADIVVMREALKRIREIGTHQPLSDLLGEETAPGPNVQTDEEIEDYIRNTVGTEFHPGSTCAMLPREQGGVVDASLKVYGTLNLRVIDGSIFPLSMSAHLMAPIYGVAEKAADLILNPPSGGDSGNAGGDTTPGGNGIPNQNTNTNNDSGALGQGLSTYGVSVTSIASALVGLFLL